MKKLVPSVIALVILMLTGSFCTQVQAGGKKYQEKHLIADMKSEKIFLYYDKKNTESMYNGFYLKSGKKVKYFKWKNICKPGFEPTIHLIDSKHIVVCCTEGEGTGFDKKELHILDRSTLKSYSTEKPSVVIGSNVTSSIKGTKVIIKMKNKTYQSICKGIDTTQLYDKIAYDSITKYNFKRTYYTAVVPVEIAPAEFAGEFKITYQWNKKKSSFVPIRMNFHFYDTIL